MARELPPRVPVELPEIERVIMLLGVRAKGLELTAPRRRELVTLIEVYPDPLSAAKWKSELRQIRAELIAEGPDPEAS